MAEFFIEPEEGLTERPELEQREGEDDEIFALSEMAISEIRRNTNRLASGDISVAAWYDQMVDILAAYHLAGWYIGAGEDTDPSDEQMDMLSDILADQLEYLDGFRDALLAEPSDITLSDAYRNRADMYAHATGISLWVGRTYGVYGFILPFVPRQASICTIFCSCAWQIDPVDEEAGDYDATWLLGRTDHCATCQARSALRPLHIRGGIYDASQISAGMYN